ncbi:MAG: hypothetical protein CO032_00500 [Nitrosopumilales archaeon CG_4_9_14_0_2_um_filter_34_16]|nr:MAG: hypothetical protein CO032_00500 [Nitrosopumilales archaeon CG_4_9_14_0_2_um_filter_34_16]
MTSIDMTRKLILFSSSALLLGLIFSLALVMNNQNDEIVGVSSSYSFSAIEPEDVTKLATSVVRGTIIDQKQVIDYKDKETQDGEIKKAFLKVPSQIYTIQTENVIKGETTPKTFEVKMRGGIVDGITWNAGFGEYSLGDEVILILDKKDHNSFYQPVSEFFGVYQIEGNMALSQERQFTESVLLEKLQ